MAPPGDPAPGAAAPSGLAATDITVAYSGVDVVHGADLHLPQGQVTALIGPNGSGKSTLLRAIARLHSARTGTVTVGGGGGGGRARPRGGGRPKGPPGGRRGARPP
ncbi:ABC transporter ATP-binding protein, partial [Streptomyces sp. NPDC091263]|uniref:ABC transporter ATP-binding protein n=1 Tax=Streptomyces sp. NPDC091263 TaxID=3155194 RepID=UPI0034506846